LGSGDPKFGQRPPEWATSLRGWRAACLRERLLDGRIRVSGGSFGRLSLSSPMDGIIVVDAKKMKGPPVSERECLGCV